MTISIVFGINRTKNQGYLRRTCRMSLAEPQINDKTSGYTFTKTSIALPYCSTPFRKGSIFFVYLRVMLLFLWFSSAFLTSLRTSSAVCGVPRVAASWALRDERKLFFAVSKASIVITDPLCFHALLYLG
jgi:hypothetical protein